MRLFLFICSFFLSSLSYASPIVMRYDLVELPKFIQSVTSQVLHSGYIISPSVLSNTRRVTVNTTIPSAEEFEPFFQALLSSYGVSYVRKDGSYYFDQASVASQSLPLLSSTSTQSSLPTDLSIPSSLDSSVGHTPSFVSLDYYVYSPRNTSSEIICAFINSIFTDKACKVSGLSSVLALPPALLSKARELLPELDKSLPRVLVSFAFVEVSSGQTKSFGLSLAGDVLSRSFKFSPATLAGGALSITGSSGSLVLDQLMTDSRFKQVTAPSALVLSGERFQINVGDRQPTLGAVVNTGNGQSSQSIVYQNSGIILDVLPSVVRSLDGQRVFLDLSSELSSFKSTSTGVNGSPTLSQRRIKTTISMADDEVFVLGGLTTRSTTSTHTSFLGLPVGSTASDGDTDLLLVLSAKVVD